MPITHILVILLPLVYCKSDKGRKNDILNSYTEHTLLIYKAYLCNHNRSLTFQERRDESIDLEYRRDSNAQHLEIEMPITQRFYTSHDNTQRL